MDLPEPSGECGSKEKWKRICPSRVEIEVRICLTHTEQIPAEKERGFANCLTDTEQSPAEKGRGFASAD